MELISGNVFIRKMGGDEGLSPGLVVDGHSHNFDHTTIFFWGRWRVRRWFPAVAQDGTRLRMPDGEEAWVMTNDFEREAPFHILIEAKCRHEFTFIGATVPDWMKPYLAKLSVDDAEAFRVSHEKSPGKAWCVYSHRTSQGDVSEANTGFYGAYT